MKTIKSVEINGKKLSMNFLYGMYTLSLDGTLITDNHSFNHISNLFDRYVRIM